MDNIINGLAQNQPMQNVQQQITPQAVVPPIAQPIQQNVVQPNLFTQEQVNSIVGTRVNTLNNTIADLRNQLSQAQQLNNSYLNEINGYRNKEVAKANGVPTDFVDFAVFEASKLAVNGKSFADAMREYVATKGSLFGIPNQNNQTIPQPDNSQQVAGVTGLGNPTQIIQSPNNLPNNLPNNDIVKTDINNNIQTNSPTQTNNLQIGSTAPNNAGKPDSSNIDIEVQNFLKANKLIN